MSSAFTVDSAVEPNEPVYILTERTVLIEGTETKQFCSAIDDMCVPPILHVSCDSDEIADVRVQAKFVEGGGSFLLTCNIPCVTNTNMSASCGMTRTLNIDYYCQTFHVHQQAFELINLDDIGLSVTGKNALYLGVTGKQDCIIKFRPVNDDTKVAFVFGCGYAKKSYCLLNFVGNKQERLTSAEISETEIRYFWVTWNTTHLVAGRGCQTGNDIILTVTDVPPIPDIGKAFLHASQSNKEWILSTLQENG